MRLVGLGEKGVYSTSLIGLFLRPIVLAVFYELLAGWVQLDPHAEGSAPPG